MSDPMNVLFLCTGNSARSILAEVLMTHHGRGRFRGLSAGSQPRGAVNPHAIALLRQMKLPVEDLSSKSWDAFAGPDAPQMHFVFTVCDSAAAETCPVWPGQPISAHWGVPDPAAVTGSEAEIMAAFRDAFRMLERRIAIFASLPVDRLDRMKLTERVRAIGRDGA